ncbi:hypothetical protein LCGC14_2023090, partial [marine sediment metagenome]
MSNTIVSFANVRRARRLAVALVALAACSAALASDGGSVGINVETLPTPTLSFGGSGG